MSIRSSLFFLLRRAQPHIHIWHALAPIWPFGLPASKQLSYLFLIPPFSLVFLSPILLSLSTIDAKLVAQPNIGAYVLLADYHRRLGAASKPGARMKEWSIDV
jgi:hypothetical protein